MILLSIGDLVGRFHPLLVHLPIGFLILAVLFYFIAYKDRFSFLQQAVPLSLLLGCLGAVFSCITGYILSLSGDYDEDILNNHRWAGIATAVVAFFAFLVSIKKLPPFFLRSKKVSAVSLLVIMVLVSVAGHFGGSLTHGDGYLAAGLDGGKANQKKVFTKVEDAVIYADVIAPILETKCSGCHNGSKKKGKLNMKDFTSLMKGGKHGPVIEPGNAMASEMMKRVMLDPGDKKFMPGDGKPPLTDQEIKIIKWWIDKTKANELKTIAQAAPDDDTRQTASVLLGISKGSTNLEGGGNSEKDAGIANNYFTSLQVTPVSKDLVDRLNHTGWVVRLVNADPDLLDMGYPANSNKPLQVDDLKELLKVKDNIVWLNLSNNNLADAQMNIVAQCKNLQRLRLDKNPITDAGILLIKNLAHLESLNLVHTKVTSNAITMMAELPNLKTVYVWNTGVQMAAPDSTGSKFKVVGGIGGR